MKTLDFGAGIAKAKRLGVGTFSAYFVNWWTPGLQLGAGRLFFRLALA
jgi:hypothetical protein